MNADIVLTIPSLGKDENLRCADAVSHTVASTLALKVDHNFFVTYEIDSVRK